MRTPANQSNHPRWDRARADVLAYGEPAVTTVSVEIEVDTEDGTPPDVLIWDDVNEVLLIVETAGDEPWLMVLEEHEKGSTVELSINGLPVDLAAAVPAGVTGAEAIEFEFERHQAALDAAPVEREQPSTEDDETSADVTAEGVDDHSELIASLSVKAAIEQVGDDDILAEQVLTIERDRAKPRTTLIDALLEIIDA